MKVYQNRRIARALRPLLSAPVTVMLAPPGYGKTAQARAYLSKRRTVQTVWISSEDRGGSKPPPYGDTGFFPLEHGEKSGAELTVLVLDDAETAPETTVRRLLDWQRARNGRRLALLGRSAPAGLPRDWLAENRFAVVGKKDLALSRGEAAEWFAREGLALMDETWELVEGWPVLLWMCLQAGGRPCRDTAEGWVRENVLPALPAALRSALAAMANGPGANRSRKAERMLAAYAEDGPLDWNGTDYRLHPALRNVLTAEPQFREPERSHSARRLAV